MFRSRWGYLGSSVALTLAVAVSGMAQGVSGDIRSGSGEIVPNAWVIIGRQIQPGGAPPMPLGAAATPVMGAPVASAMVNNQGRFSQTKLADGDYFACASTRIAGLIPSCQWGGTPTPFSVKNGVSSPLHFILQKGSTLRISVDDPGKSLEKAKNGRVGDLTVHMTSIEGHIVPALSVDPTGNQKNYEVTIPFDKDMKLWIASSSVALGDDKGEQLPSGGKSQDVRHSSMDAATRKPIAIKILGER